MGFGSAALYFTLARHWRSLIHRVCTVDDEAFTAGVIQSVVEEELRVLTAVLSRVATDLANLSIV